MKTFPEIPRVKADWQRRGLIYCPDGSGFFKTHAARPVTAVVDDKRLRVFFSSRDHDDRMLPTFIDVDRQDPSRILHINQAPLVDIGRPGCFDDSGVTLGSIVDQGDTALLYYTGWKRRRVISFELAIGVIAWDKRRDTFERVFEGPILAQDRFHPLLTAGPYVLHENGRFRMWYCSGTDWRFQNGNPEPIYTVFHAESEDGIDWTPRPEPVIPYLYDGEVISAPWVVRSGNDYHMWYSYRGHETREVKSYVIGYAVSPDGIHWERRDDLAGFDRASEGWDSKMVCYPAFHREHDKMYMFYSGNDVGRGGLGWAVADASLPPFAP